MGRHRLASGVIGEVVGYLGVSPGGALFADNARAAQPVVECAKSGVALSFTQPGPLLLPEKEGLASLLYGV